jgi:hypothetical protein
MRRREEGRKFEEWRQLPRARTSYAAAAYISMCQDFHQEISRFAHSLQTARDDKEPANYKLTWTNIWRALYTDSINGDGPGKSAVSASRSSSRPNFMVCVLVCVRPLALCYQDGR